MSYYVKIQKGLLTAMENSLKKIVNPNYKNANSHANKQPRMNDIQTHKHKHKHIENIYNFHKNVIYKPSLK